ncbi:MAG: MerR family transcriptional regulator [Tidjanibacter sp.]|jgi:DNA-binding transcriptional MerR regulator|nr:MerR family transcriptional regulator [Tidjanibacter sp.]
MEEIIHPKGKIYYSMGEVCELFGVNASLLRFWEEEFTILKIAKNSRGHRIYTPADVDNLRLIYHLVKEQGMTLDGARKRLRQNRDSIKREAEIVERLQKVRNMLAALREEMGDEVEVIDIEEDVEEPTVEPKATAAPKAEAPKEELADFKMEMPSTKPAPEEPKKPTREKKVGTLIGGDLFSPEDIRLVVAKENSKKNSKEAKKLAVEQTLF